MPDTNLTTATTNTPNLGSTVVRLLQLIRELREQIADLRLALSVALQLLHEQEKAIDRGRQTNQHLRDQLRQVFKTDGHQRQRDEHNERPAA